MAAKRPLTEADARSALAAGRAVPLEWLWVLGEAEIVVTNAGKPGKTLEIGVTNETRAQS